MKATSAAALIPFQLFERDPRIVATAAIDHVCAARVKDDDPLATVRAVLDIGLEHAAQPGALLGGLVSLGDRRLLPLLVDAEWRLSTEDLLIARNCYSGYPTFGALEFWLCCMEKWVAGAVAAPDDEARNFADARLGFCGAGLSAVVVDAIRPWMLDLEREFGFCHFDPPREAVKYLREIPLADVGLLYAERFEALERAEPAPKIMSRIMPLYGLEPRCRRNEWAPIDLVALAAEKNSKDDDTTLIDISESNPAASRGLLTKLLDRSFTRVGRRLRKKRLRG